ncbi:L-threonine kinase [Selenomonas sp. GACV-9]|uniref:GHMP family kinase ATP-binding protein n=1 Tax=Selenomonas sp. GACV-9 TaxID=3158782 RepID=UPI0008E9608B|nr:L-threonine kinase [Selenomonas ruminantium]
MEITVRVPGSCGELLQGELQGEPFLVTCPIGCYTTVRVSDAFTGIHGLGRKSLMALEKTLTSLGKEELPWGIQLTSDLPRGKGMASSSADIAATVAAVALAFGYEPYLDEIMRLAVEIEPTDGVFCPGVVRINHMDGRMLAGYRGLPAFRISVYDTGGEVDTLLYHANMEDSVAEEKSLAALTQFELGVKTHDADLIAAAATASALAHQQLLPKEGLEDFLAASRRFGALGINVAHSGTVIGVLWPADWTDRQLQQAEAELSGKFPSLTHLLQSRLQSGGIWVDKGTAGNFSEWFR